jgi:DDE superfamily endonuclease
MAGRNWIKLFFSRHPQLSIRKPEAVSIQRAIGFNKPKVDIFFDLLERTCFDADGVEIIPSTHIYNMDESGFSCVQKPQKIIATKGKKNVGTLTSGERGRTVTVVCCMSAAGSFVPPMFIFPRVRMKQSLMDHSPSGSIGTCTKSGWINEEAFEFWFDHFLKSVRPHNSLQPVLLIFDGHSSHTRNLNVVLKARANNVILLCLPSHCTHRLQPLDVAFFKSLNSHYDDECRKWLREHQGRKVNEEQIPELFSLAYGKSATVSTAVNGFRRTGIAPFNRDIFSDVDFRGAEMTDAPLLPEHVEPQQSGNDVLTQSTAEQSSSGAIQAVTVYDVAAPIATGTVALVSCDANSAVDVISGEHTTAGQSYPVG